MSGPIKFQSTCIMRSERLSLLLPFPLTMVHWCSCTVKVFLPPPIIIFAGQSNQVRLIYKALVTKCFVTRTLLQSKQRTRANIKTRARTHRKQSLNVQKWQQSLWKSSGDTADWHGMKAATERRMEVTAALHVGSCYYLMGVSKVWHIVWNNEMGGLTWRPARCERKLQHSTGL